MDALHHLLYNPHKMMAVEWTYSRINWTASSYIIPHSIRAMATKTGALREKQVLTNQSHNSLSTEDCKPLHKYSRLLKNKNQ